ncbi:hypothetical protein DC20_17120 [Rufibacter tibetensis]|uniref:Uncharacterized protein n=1 Tax=Rufibacter tibetensis TaxID=512763 RepID=A0A0P0D0N8_9BACT|nr:hypothetical protein DC20_17120 [Rufibacter tibetensis]
MILITLALPQVVLAQTNYKPGYVITVKGDSLTGLIDDTYLDHNFSKVSFKQKPSDTNINYFPSQLKRFGILGKVYESAVVKTEISSADTRKLRPFPELKLETESTFLLPLAVGPKNIYFFVNSVGKEQFYLKAEDQFELLVYKRFLISDNGRRAAAENKKYVGQLALYFSDCSAIQANVSAISYTRKSFEKLLKTYFACTNNDTARVETTPKVGVELGAVTGVTFTDFSFTSPGFLYLQNAGYNRSTDVYGGLFLDIILPAYKKKLSIYNEVGFSSYSVSGSYVVPNQDFYETIQTSFDQAYLKLYNLLTYKLTASNSYAIYLKAGVGNGFSVYSKNKRVIDSMYTGTRSVQEGVSLRKTRNHEQSLVMGAGFHFQRFMGEARFEIGNGLSDYIGVNSSTTRHHFLIGYKLKK